MESQHWTANEMCIRDRIIIITVLIVQDVWSLAGFAESAGNLGAEIFVYHTAISCFGIFARINYFTCGLVKFQNVDTCLLYTSRCV